MKKINNSYAKIITFLKNININYDLLEHEPIFTMEDTKKIIGLSEQEGVKSILIKTPTFFVLTVLLGTKRLHSKKLKNILAVRDIRFANADEVRSVMGCEIGSCYPLGNLLNIKMLVDNNLSSNKVISFTPGVHTKTIKMQWKDYIKHVKPVLVEISE